MLSRRSNPIAALSLGLLVLALFSGGCAQQPPGRSSQYSGIRLHVVMTFRTAVDLTAFQYYFVVNKSDAKGFINQTGSINYLNGPVPVIGPQNFADSGGPANATPTNGFATGEAGAGGFTDVVAFGTQLTSLPTQSFVNGVPAGLYHVTQQSSSTQNTLESSANNPNNIRLSGLPLNVVANPAAADTTANTIAFDLDLSQIATDMSGNLFDLTSNNATILANAATAARQIQYLQFAIISTNTSPRTANLLINKITDFIGGVSNISTPLRYIQVTDGNGVVQSQTYTSGDGFFPPEQSNDIVNANGVTADSQPAAMDLVSWSITVSDTHQTR